jgi:hypothetical protein
MATDSFTEFVPGLILNDQPLAYTPAYGPAIDFTLHYREVDSSSAYLGGQTNLGPNWYFGYSSFVAIRAIGPAPASGSVDSVQNASSVHSSENPWTRRSIGFSSYLTDSEGNEIQTEQEIYLPDPPNSAFPDDHFHATYHWDKEQWHAAVYATDTLRAEKPYRPASYFSSVSQTFAEVTLWLMNSGMYSSPVVHSHLPPHGGITVYRYDGQQAENAWQAGLSDQPTSTASFMDGHGHTVAVKTTQTYTATGLPLESTDALGRRTRRTYHPNGIDLATEDVWLPATATWQTLRSYADYAGHRAQTVTDLSGLVTHLTWNTRGQLTRQIKAKGTHRETTVATYDTDGQGTPDGLPGYLMRLQATDPTQPDSPTALVIQATYTYDDRGRRRTATDAAGYTLTRRQHRADSLRPARHRRAEES